MMDPLLDGVEHINAYSKGKTQLGIMLSNFEFSPFIHPDDGPFDSIEAYWYWLLTSDESLRFTHGVVSKELGKKLTSEKKEYPSDFKEKIKTALLCKIDENPKIKKALLASSLPVVHYYVRSSEGKEFSVPLKKHDWVFKEIENIRSLMNGGPILHYDEAKKDAQHGLF